MIEPVAVGASGGGPSHHNRSGCRGCGWNQGWTLPPESHPKWSTLPARPHLPRALQSLELTLPFGDQAFRAWACGAISDSSPNILFLSHWLGGGDWIRLWDGSPDPLFLSISYIFFSLSISSVKCDEQLGRISWSFIPWLYPQEENDLFLSAPVWIAQEGVVIRFFGSFVTLRPEVWASVIDLIWVFL